MTPPTVVSFAGVPYARAWRIAPLRVGALLLGLTCGACGEPRALTVDMPLHLEDHLEAAVVEGSEVPVNPPQTVE